MRLSDAQRAEILEEWKAPRATFARRIASDLQSDATLEEVTRALDAAIVDGLAGGAPAGDLEDRERIISVVGHDLRAPLSTMSLAADRLALDASLNEGVQRTVQRIVRSARTMTAMIRDLTDFARGRFIGGVPIAPQRVALAPIVRGVADELEAAHGRVIRRELTGDLTGTWDGERLRQVLSNLLTNALVHGRGDVTVEANGAEGALTLRVHDAGAPIPAEAQARLFEPFHKAPGSKGLGLGLYIVRELVRAHGGTVALTSDETGTAVVATIPR